MSDTPINLTAGLPETVLSPEPQDALDGLDAALRQPDADRRDAVSAVVARFPAFLDGWARLGELARDDVEAYACYRVGYHRGLDRLRQSGWRGSGYVRSRHPSNRGFLRALRGLGDTAGRLGEDDEARRCHEFLFQLDPDDKPEEERARGERLVMASKAPVVGVIMGSDSDLEVMTGAIEVLREFGVTHEVRIVSAHRTPDVMVEYARTAATRGLRVIIAGAGGAAHLPGMTASLTPLPVIGVPVALRQLDGLDSLLSIVQMPAGVPVATVAVGNARNAGLLAVRILATSDPALLARMEKYQAELAEDVRTKDQRVRGEYA